MIYSGYKIQIKSHFDSREAESINVKQSVRIGNIIGTYLLSQQIDPRLLVVRGNGNFEPLRRCPDGVVCSQEVYSKNTRIEYRVIDKPGIN